MTRRSSYGLGPAHIAEQERQINLERRRAHALEVQRRLKEAELVAAQRRAQLDMQRRMAAQAERERITEYQRARARSVHVGFSLYLLAFAKLTRQHRLQPDRTSTFRHKSLRTSLSVVDVYLTRLDRSFVPTRLCQA